MAAIRDNPGSVFGAFAASATTAGAAAAGAAAASASTTTVPAFFRLDTFGTGVYARFINALTILAGTGFASHCMHWYEWLWVLRGDCSTRCDGVWSGHWHERDREHFVSHD